MALIGAREDDDLGTDSGSAYIFSETTPGVWTQVAKLTAGDGAAGDYVRVRSVLHCPRWHGVYDDVFSCFCFCNSHCVVSSFVHFEDFYHVYDLS